MSSTLYTHIPSGLASQAQFRLESVDEVTAPEGQLGVWQRYVITQGANRIVGTRAGAHSDVTLLLTEQVERLNVRLGKQKARR